MQLILEMKQVRSEKTELAATNNAIMTTVEQPLTTKIVEIKENQSKT